MPRMSQMSRDILLSTNSALVVSIRLSSSGWEAILTPPRPCHSVLGGFLEKCIDYELDDMIVELRRSNRASSVDLYIFSVQLSDKRNEVIRTNIFRCSEIVGRHLQFRCFINVNPWCSVYTEATELDELAGGNFMTSWIGLLGKTSIVLWVEVGEAI